MGETLGEARPKLTVPDELADQMRAAEREQSTGPAREIGDLVVAFRQTLLDAGIPDTLADDMAWEYFWAIIPHERGCDCDEDED